MNDSSINPILLSSSAHLENVEQLIKNLEKQTLDLDNFEDILSDRNRQEIITESFSSVTSHGMSPDETPDDNFLVKSISLANTGNGTAGFHDENLSMDSLLDQRDLFEFDDMKKQQTPPANDQSSYNDLDSGFIWDDQYDARANYCLTFSTDKTRQIESKRDKIHRRQHKNRKTDTQSNLTYSNDNLSENVANNMNDWSMRLSFNVLGSSDEHHQNKTPVPSDMDQQTAFTRSRSYPLSLSPQQQLPNNDNNHNHNNSPNSSTTSSSSSASWRRMKESHRTTPNIESKDAQLSSPLSLYKIFQRKSQMASSSFSPRSAFQYYRQQCDSVVPSNIESMTISGEKVVVERPKSTQHQKRRTHTDRISSQTNSSTDQAIQTSILVDSPPNSQLNSRLQSTPTTAVKPESYDNLSTNTSSTSRDYLGASARPSPVSISSSSAHKSLPDLAFISQYSKELPRSRTTSPLPPTPIPSNSSSVNTTSSPIIVQQQQEKHESERPRTLKSIKRYKNSKHSTEPLGVFYSPQLGKTFAAVPASAVINGSNEAPKIIKMRLSPPTSSCPNAQQQQGTQNLKSCFKHRSRANSCDIQAILEDKNLSAPPLPVPKSTNDRDSLSPTKKRRCSEVDTPANRSNNLCPSNMHNTGSSDNIVNYILDDFSDENRSDHDLTLLQQQNQTKKSVSFSDNIAKHLISPCNPAIKFDLSSDLMTDYNARTKNDDPAIALHGNKENLKRKPTSRYSEMRRCQTDIIVVDRVHHLYTFTESPPNEFRLQETDSLVPEREDEDDQTIMEKTHLNIMPNVDQPPIVPSDFNKKDELDLTIEKITSSNDKENRIHGPSLITNTSTTTLIPTDDPLLDDILEKITAIVKRVFEIKRSERTFFLSNERNTRLDSLLKDDLCMTLQNILEHGLKAQRKDLPLVKQITVWKIIEMSIDHGQSLQVFFEAKKLAQNTSPYWLYQFQAFIFALLNKNELINWLYHFSKQKDTLQRYYHSSHALILSSTDSTFKIFDRIMTQLEKLAPLGFRLVYKPAPVPADIEEQLGASTKTGIYSTKTNTLDWVTNISRRTTKNLTQPIVQPNTTNTNVTAATTTTTNTETVQPTDTLRSTLSRKLNSIFTKTNEPQRKTSSVVTTKLPTSKPQTVEMQSTTSTSTGIRRPRTSNLLSNAAAATTTSKPVIVSSPKLNNGTRASTIRRGISPTVPATPSPPSTVNTNGTTPSTTTAAFQSKIPRPSLNVDKPKSARYRSTAPPPK